MTIPTFIVAYVWPVPTSGAGLALLSTIKFCLHYLDNVHLIVVSNQPKEEYAEIQTLSRSWHIQIIKQKRWIRFFQGMLDEFPAITKAFQASIIYQEIEFLIQKFAPDGKFVLVCEDIPIAVLALSIKKKFPNAFVIVRSHNVLFNCFELFTQSGLWWKRLAWRIEIERQRKFEKEILDLSDCFLPMTCSDLREYNRIYRKEMTRFLGVTLNCDKYDCVLDGEISKVLYLGSADLQKGEGLTRFIKTGWTKIRETLPNTELHLAGRFTDRFQDTQRGIWGQGFCENELEFLSKGKIFINPQDTKTGGIKLKNLVAMLAGKVLITTSNGVEGIPGEHGCHFFVADSAEELDYYIIKVLQNPKSAYEIGNQAKRLAQKVYSEEAFMNSAEKVFEDLLSTQLASKFGLNDASRF